MKYITPQRKAVVDKTGKIINVIVADDTYKLDTEVYPECTLFDCADLPVKVGDKIVNGKWDYQGKDAEANRALKLKYSDGERRSPEQLIEMKAKRLLNGIKNSPDIIDE